MLGITAAVAVTVVPSVAGHSAVVAPQSAPDTLTANRRRRAERLLQDRVACLGCHRLEGSGGAIGPSLDGVGERLSREFILRVIVEPQSVRPGTSMPAQPLAPGDAELLADFLTSGATWSGALPDPLPPDTLSGGIDPEALYRRHCASCHGERGNGDGWNAVNLPVPPTVHADSATMAGRLDDQLYDAIHAGGWVLDRSARMPAFGALLTPGQIRMLVDYIRELCRCSAPAWSRDGVRRTGGPPLG